MINQSDTGIYDAIPGGADLVHWFGHVPTFHDAEILRLDLRRKGRSDLRLHGWSPTGEFEPDGYTPLYRHAVVTFSLHEVMDLQLDGFSGQNVINGLVLRRAPDRPERRNCLALDPLPEDIEIELEPCYGLDGLIRARSVSITFRTGKPARTMPDQWMLRLPRAGVRGTRVTLTWRNPAEAIRSRRWRTLSRRMILARPGGTAMYRGN